jgi:hypothetical protein
VEESIIAGKGMPKIFYFKDNTFLNKNRRNFVLSNKIENCENEYQ